MHQRDHRRPAVLLLAGLLTILAIAAAPGTAAAQGPRAYVGDMTVITGDSSAIACPAGYAKNPRNLNEGAGGDHIYLCLRYQNRVDNAITWLTVVRGIDIVGPPECNHTLIDVDLNKGAGGVITPSFCYSRTSYGLPYNNPRHDPRPVRDVWFWSTGSDPCSLVTCGDAIQQGCESAKPAGRDIDTVVADDQDLNEDAGGRYVFTCWGRGPADAAPSLWFESRTAPNADGWNKSPVVVTWRCSDSEGPPSELFPSVTLWGEGPDQSATGRCSDDAGNVTTNTQTGINIDLTNPRIFFVGPDTGGWTRGPAVLTWKCDDSLSGVRTATVTQILSTEGSGQSATGTCRDRADNEASDTRTGINIDATSPTIRFVGRTPANAAGWNRGPVVLTWECEDDLSGVEQTTVRRTVSSEGAGQSATGVCRDRAGNEASDTRTKINIDGTDPVMRILSRTPAPNADGWNNGDVTLEWSCDDDLSGPAEPSVSRKVTGEGDGMSVTGTCSDVAGNGVSAKEGGIRIDRTQPLISAAATTADGKPYTAGTWTSQDVTVAFSCKDRLSGVASVSPPKTLSANGNDQQRAEGTCEDRAGNGATVSFTAIQIDDTPPTLTCSVDPATLWPPNHKLVPVRVSVQMADDLSGPAAFALTAARSNEPDDGLGDGDTTEDIRGFAIGTADADGELRAERSGQGSGRVYTLEYAGRDAAGNAATCAVTVTVPHDRGD